MEIEALIGKTITKITGADIGSGRIEFECSDGSEYSMYHYQDCCESVTIEDICGDINDLLNTPIVQAFEKTNSNENPDGVPIKEYQDSWTWTFYTLATISGGVTLRWYGESNGYYSEDVDFVEITN